MALKTKEEPEAKALEALGGIGALFSCGRQVGLLFGWMLTAEMGDPLFSQIPAFVRIKADQVWLFEHPVPKTLDVLLFFGDRFYVAQIGTFEPDEGVDVKMRADELLTGPFILAGNYLCGVAGIFIPRKVEDWDKAAKAKDQDKMLEILACHGAPPATQGTTRGA